MTTATSSRPPVPRPTGARPRTSAVPATTRTLDPFRVLRRHLLLILSSIVTGVVLGFVAFVLFYFLLPLYSAVVVFEIRGALDEGFDPIVGDIERQDVLTRLATTEMYLLLSRPVLEAAVKKPDVQNTTWYIANFAGDLNVGELDEAVDELEDDLRARLVAGSNLFTLKWSNGNALDVPEVLGAVADAYIAKRKADDRVAYNVNLEVFQSQLGTFTRNLDDLGQEIEAYIREKGITDIDHSRSSQLAMAQEGLTGQISNSQASLSFAENRYLQLAAKLEGTVSPTEEDRRRAEMDALVRPHEAAMLGTKTVLYGLREQYRDPDHPMILRGEARLRATEAEYENKIKEIMTDNLQAELKQFGAQIESLRSVLDGLEEKHEQNDGLLRTLSADMSHYREMEYQRELLLGRRDDTLVAINEIKLVQLRDDARRVRIAQNAQLPREKSFPKIELVVPLTTLLVVGSVIGLIFLREITDQRVKSAADIEVLPSGRVLGVIPELAEDPCKSAAAELVVRECPNSVLAESYRQVSALIAKAMDQSGHRTLLLVGGLPDAGTTTAATNLAAAAAAAGRKVVIVDGNFRRPRLAEVMGVSGDDPGLGDLLAGEASLDEVIRTTEHGIDVVTAGRPANRAFERLNNGAFDSVMAELRTRYDLVLVDAPPAVVAGDALVLANKLDAAVLIVRANQEQRGLVARLINQLMDASCEQLGVILNRPRGTAGGYFKKNFAAMAGYSSTSSAT